MEVMNEREVLEAISKTQKGQFRTLCYEKRESKKKLSARGLYTLVTYQIQLVDYENKGKVKAYRESTGEGPCNPAVINEEATDVFGVYLNVKTNKMKLRVPVNGCKAIDRKYFADGREVSKDEYYQIQLDEGYAVAKPAPSKTGVEFRSFCIDQIVWYH